MLRSPSTRWIPLAALFVGLELPAGAAFPGTEVFLPMVGRAPGVPPSVWDTKVWVHNPGSSDAFVRFYFLERNKDNSALTTYFDDTVRAGDTHAYDNALLAMFGASGWGAIRVVSDEKVIVNERMYNQLPGATEKDSQGQDFAAVPRPFAIGAGEGTVVLGVDQTIPAAASDFRYNFGLVEVTGHSCKVRVTAVDEAGTPLGPPKTYNVLPYSQQQRAFKDVWPNVSAENGRLLIEVSQGPGEVLAYGAAIANGSQDPTTFEMAFDDDLLGIAAVQHDGTLTGDGTAALPLGLADGAVTVEKLGTTNAPAAGAASDGSVSTRSVAATQFLATDGSTLSWAAATAVSGLSPGGLAFGGTAGALAQDTARLFWDDLNNRLGIGTDSPSQQLELTGNLKLPATTAAVGQLWLGGKRFVHGFGPDNVFLGNNAGNFTMTGWNNTGIGFNALTADTTGANNTGVGTFALESVTSGLVNTAVGSAALRLNTTGEGNTALGSDALSANIDGHRNTAVGSGALLSTSDGSYNTAVGASALILNTTASSNTAVGFAALNQNTTGAANVACGAHALDRNSDGSDNSAFGTGALWNNTSGGYNVAVGSRALWANTIGAANVAVGPSALADLTDGSGNVAVGYQAGLGLATGGSNVLIGAVAGAGDESGTIRIGSAGTHTRAFLAGVRGVTTESPDGIPVFVDSSGQLGTVSSSARFKQDIHQLGDVSETLERLRPVTFRYTSQPAATHFGLIAEEVEQVLPDLVVRGSDGRPETVLYHELPALLLAELQRQQRRLIEQEQQLVAQWAELAELRRQLASVAAAAVGAKGGQLE